MRGEKATTQTASFRGRSPRPALKEHTTSASIVIRSSSHQQRVFSHTRTPSPPCEIHPRTQSGRAPGMAPGEDFHARLHFGTDWRGNDREELLSDLAERDTWAKACHNEYKLRQVVLAVVGMPRSGKSTFIQHALDLKKPPSSKVATKRVSLEGTVSILEIHEYDVHEIEINSDGTPHWPENAADDITGKVNGVLVIYSIEDIASTKPIPAVLRKSTVNAS